MPFLTVRHVTTYRYKQPVAFGEHRVMFRPRDSYDQRLLHASIQIDPEPATLHWMHDVFGNCVACVHFTGRATTLRFESLIQLDHAPMHLLDFPIAPQARSYPFSYDQEDMPDLLRSIERQYPDRNHELRNWAAGFTGTGRIQTADLLARITQSIRRDFTYVRREEMGIQEPLQTLKLRSGSCRDFALLMMEAGALAGLRRALRVRLSVCAAARGGQGTRRPGPAAVRPMPGYRFTCRAPGGWSSIRPTAFPAITT